jgi:hypothetical protein
MKAEREIGPTRPLELAVRSDLFDELPAKAQQS